MRIIIIYIFFSIATFVTYFIVFYKNINEKIKKYRFYIIMTTILTLLFIFIDVSFSENDFELSSKFLIIFLFLYSGLTTMIHIGSLIIGENKFIEKTSYVYLSTFVINVIAFLVTDNARRLYEKKIVKKRTATDINTLKRIHEIDPYSSLVKVDLPYDPPVTESVMIPDSERAVYGIASVGDLYSAVPVTEVPQSSDSPGLP